MDNYVSNDLLKLLLVKSLVSNLKILLAFMAVLDGRSFIPMGGVHDGGLMVL
jgi:hypothetical protein